MKWFGSIITTLIVLALTSIVGGLLKGPIDDMASGSRLQADVQLAPWFNKPDETGQGAKPAPESKSDRSTELSKVYEDAMQAADDAARALQLNLGEFQVARVLVRNESNKLVTDINFRLVDYPAAEIAVVIDESGKQSVHRNVSRLTLPNLKPGDRTTVFLWSNYLNSNTLPKVFKTYSSEGRFRIKFDWPQTQTETYSSGVGEFLDEYSGTIATVCGFAILLMAIVGLAAMESYYKDLLKDPEFLVRERKRFDENPKKFSPNFTKADTAKSEESNNPTEAG